MFQNMSNGVVDLILDVDPERVQVRTHGQTNMVGGDLHSVVNDVKRGAEVSIGDQELRLVEIRFAGLVANLQLQTSNLSFLSPGNEAHEFRLSCELLHRFLVAGKSTQQSSSTCGNSGTRYPMLETPMEQDATDSRCEANRKSR